MRPNLLCWKHRAPNTHLLKVQCAHCKHCCAETPVARHPTSRGLALSFGRRDTLAVAMPSARKFSFLSLILAAEVSCDLGCDEQIASDYCCDAMVHSDLEIKAISVSGKACGGLADTSVDRRDNQKQLTCQECQPMQRT